MSKIDVKEIRLSGLVISSGIAIGKPFFLKTFQKSISNEKISKNQVVEEFQRFCSAIEKVSHDLKTIQLQLQIEGIKEGVDLIESQLQILSDPILIESVKKQISSTLKKSDFVLHQIIQEYQQKFEQFDDPFFRERFQDLQDVSKRIFNHLTKDTSNSLNNLTADCILFANDLSPSETAEASQKQVKGIVSERGSATAHASILARAQEIPYMTNISIALISNHPESVVIVDGKIGQLIINPQEETLAYYQKLSHELNEQRHRHKRSYNLPVETYDGYKMKLFANIETSNEISKVHEYGGDGVGLYRSENILVGRKCIPSENEQFEIYSDLIKKMNELPITIRTFDVGRDKAGIDIKHSQTGSAFLGFRAIENRDYEKDVFFTQLKAILRASVFGKVNILIPMVSSLTELLKAKQMLHQASQELNISSHVGFGCMIEVPSAAIIADLLAKHCDFLSIGTNDLIHYTLGVDRCDIDLSHLYQPTHPCVLRLIRHVIVEANRHRIPVSICGEIASNPKFTPLLLGLGIHEISVAGRYIPLIKQMIRLSSIISCCDLADKALTLDNAQQIHSLLEDAFNNHFAKNILEELI